MHIHKGWIALDIDGTITDQKHHIPKEVVEYLTTLQREGWQIIFITGRTLSFASAALASFSFSCFLAIQNGSVLLSMPEQAVIEKSYLPSSIVPVLEKVYLEQLEDFIVYAGFEKGDFCYYRPGHFSKELLNHLEVIKELSSEPWQAVKVFNFSKEDTFPLIKCLGSYEAMNALNHLLKAVEGIAVSMIRDPLQENTYLNLITAVQATKGNVLKKVMQKKGLFGPVIAAGDDFNDISMLECADVSIVMQTAPEKMLKMGDIIALPAKDLGIINALGEAIERVIDET